MKQWVTPLLAVAGTSVCATFASAYAMPNVTVAELALNLGDYKGRTVRVCGSDFRHQQDGRLVLEAPVGRHVARVYAISCTGEAQPLRQNGCFVGRIALQDGTDLSAAQQDLEVLVQDDYVSETWFFHPQCR